MPKKSKLTQEERKARESKRIAEWRHAHPENVRAYRLKRIRMAALRDILANAPEFAEFCRSKGLSCIEGQHETGTEKPNNG